jgi:hypothetical protein
VSHSTLSFFFFESRGQRSSIRADSFANALHSSFFHLFSCTIACESSHSPPYSSTMHSTLAVHCSEFAAVDKHASLSATLHCPGLKVVDILTDTTLICDASMQINLSPAKKVVHGVQVNFREIMNTLTPALVRDQPCRAVCTAATQAAFPSEFFTVPSFFSDGASTPSALTSAGSHRQRRAIKFLGTNPNQSVQAAPAALPAAELPPVSQEIPVVSSTTSTVQEDHKRGDCLLQQHDALPTTSSELVTTSVASQEHHEPLTEVLSPAAVARSELHLQVDPVIPSGCSTTVTEITAAVDDSMLVLEMQGKERMVSDLVNINGSHNNSSNSNNSNGTFSAAYIPTPVGLANNAYQVSYNYSSIADFIAQASGACIPALDTSFTSVTSGSGSDGSSVSMYSTPSSAASLSSAYAQMPWCQLCNQYGHIFDMEMTHGVLYAKSNTAYLHGSFCEICGAVSHKTEAHIRIDTRRQKICTRAYTGTCAYDPCKFSHSEEEMLYLRNHPVIDGATPMCFKTVPFGGRGIPHGMKLILGCFKIGVDYETCCKRS